MVKGTSDTAASEHAALMVACLPALSLAISALVEGGRLVAFVRLAKSSARSSALPCGAGWDGGGGGPKFLMARSLLHILPKGEWESSVLHHSNHFCSLTSVFTSVAWRCTAVRRDLFSGVGCLLKSFLMAFSSLFISATLLSLNQWSLKVLLGHLVKGIASCAASSRLCLAHEP
ncbi:hypothetical protein E2C01_101581 [Portunus trituberculatus]|uniref:Uncharacterized protein n=1 Tax=Portunus trituberculatus TaxID=210409 RepID=A0A5B7KB39_PORTR|nr:hypothetical protein [Portunus trituberculatus]